MHNQEPRKKRSYRKLMRRHLKKSKRYSKVSILGSEKQRKKNVGC